MVCKKHRILRDSISIQLVTLAFCFSFTVSFSAQGPDENGKKQYLITLTFVCMIDTQSDELPWDYYHKMIS